MTETIRTAAAHRPRGRAGIEHRVLLLALAGGFPAVALVIGALWSQPYTFEVRWTVAGLILAAWLGCAALARGGLARAARVGEPAWRPA